MILTQATRQTMPSQDFAGGGHSFPVNDATHQRLAISGATRAYNAGNISQAKEEHIKAIARALLQK